MRNTAFRDVWKTALAVSAIGFVMLVTASVSLQAQSVNFAGIVTGLPGGYLYPTGVAVDANGNVFVANGDNSVKKIPAGCNSGSCVVTLAGGFSGLWGVAVDNKGDVFVSSFTDNSNIILNYTPAGTMHGQVQEIPPGCSSAGCALTLGGGFYGPLGLGVDRNGNVWVADINAPSNGGTGAVKEIPPGCASASCVVSVGITSPFGVAVDAAGDVFVAQTIAFVNGNNVSFLSDVWEIESVGGSVPVNPTYFPLWASFSFLQGLSVDGSGNVYVADAGGGPEGLGAIDELVATNGAIPNAFQGKNDIEDVLGPVNLFNTPAATAVDGNGNVYVASEHDNAVREIVRNVNFGTVAVGIATPPTLSLTFNFNSSQTIGAPVVLTQGASGLDFTDAGTGSCTTNGTSHSYSVSDTCTVVVKFAPNLAGPRNGAVEIVDNSGNVLATAPVFGVGSGPQIAFNPSATSTRATGVGVNGLAVDGASNLYAVSLANNQVLRVTPSGTQTAIGSGLLEPAAVTLDGAGNVYIADAGNNRVVEVSPSGVQTVKLDSANPLNHVVEPRGVAADGVGNIYVSDSQSGSVVKVAFDGTQTIVGSGFGFPTAVALDAANDVFVADAAAGKVVEITPAGLQTTIGSGFTAPQSLAVDAAGNVFVVDLLGSPIIGYGSVPADSRLVEVSPGGVQSVLASGTVASGGFFPYSVTIGPAGNIFVGDASNNEVYLWQRLQPKPMSFAPTAIGSTSSDSPHSVRIANIGNAPLTSAAPGLSVSSNFKQTSGSGTLPDCQADFSLVPGGECNLSISFIPQQRGSIQGSVVLSDNALNASRAIEKIQLSGSGQQASQTITFNSIPTQTQGTPLQLGATVGSGLTVTYTASPSSVCTVSGNTATMVNGGTCSITASQAGNADYSAANAVTQSFTVLKLQNLRFLQIPTQLVGQVLRIPVETDAGPLSSIVVSSQTPNVCTVSGDNATMVAAGTCALYATQSGNLQYAPATAIANFTVNPKK